MLRASSAVISPISIVVSTVRQWWLDERTDSGLPTLDRFPQFSAYRPEMAFNWYSSSAENSRNRSNLAILAVTIFRGCAARRHRTPPHVFIPRSRVSALLIVATGRGNTRVWLIVAGSRRSATARGWNGKMATLLRFAPFRGNLEVQSPTMK